MNASLKLWTPLQIVLATFFGGPMAGCYFLGRNYKAANRREQARYCYIAGALLSMLSPMMFAFSSDIVPLSFGVSLGISIIACIALAGVYELAWTI